jgi:hypothetical protein
MALLLGAGLGWFFGWFIATLFAVAAERRGEEDALRYLAKLERDVHRDERLAARAYESR